MGCGGSTNNEKQSSLDGGGRRGSIFRRQPKVSIKIGNAAKILDRKPTVVFVFGGPGTRKGKLLDNLTHVFGFEVINVEKVILEELTKNLDEPQPNRTVPAIQQMLKTEQEMLRLDTVLKMISRRLDEVDKNKFCIVDFMPNLKWMLNNPTFIKECTNEVRFFEEKYPISFVMHFVIPKEKVLNKIETDTPKSPTVEQKKQESGRQSDEADSSRTQKRVLLFENSIKHFMDYFRKKDKVVTIDVSCAIPEVIWVKVCEFFSEFDFIPSITPETVVVFGFDQEELDDINIGQYSLTVVTLRELAVDPNASVEALLDQVCKFVDKCDPTRRVFAVDGTGTSLTKDLKKKKENKFILFQETDDNCRLGRYCNVNLTTKGDLVQMQAVATVQNEVCLFSKQVSPDLCTWIASVMRECRNKTS